jgi:hypothetical protein
MAEEFQRIPVSEGNVFKQFTKSQYHDSFLHQQLLVRILAFLTAAGESG